MLPQGFEFAGIFVTYYGIFMATAVLVAYLSALRLASRFGFSSRLLENLFPFVLLGGFVVARLYHVLSDWDYYFSRPYEVWAIWHGGLSIFGAVGGGVLVLWVYARVKKIQFLLLCDWLILPVLIGQIIGRFGNLFNYEALGLPTELPWGLFVPESLRFVGYESFSYFHPFPIYEQVLNLVLLVALWVGLRNRVQARPVGQVLALYLIGYGLVRFVLEWIRLDHLLFLGFPVNAITSLGLIFIGLFLYFVKVRKKYEHA